MSDELQAKSPGLPAAPPANAGPIPGIDNLVNAPPIDWGAPLPVSSEQQAQAQAAGGGIVEGAPAPAVAKPSRKRVSKVVAAAGQEQAGAAKATRTRKKAAPAAVVVTQGQPAGAAAAGSTPGADDGIPPITAEAIDFLGNPDATAADVLKLDPDSLTFVQHYFDLMRRLEPDSQANKAYLMANTFAAALLDARASLVPGKEPTAAMMPEPDKPEPAMAPATSYDQKAAIAAYAPVAVQFGMLDRAAGKARAPDLVEPARTAYKEVGEQEAQRAMEAQEPENSIERSPAQQVLNEQKLAQSAAPAAKVASAAESRPGLGKRLMLVVGGAAQQAGTWLSGRGKEGHGQAMPAARAAPPAPISLAKAAVSTEPTAPAATRANDKSTMVPEAVARRFLKVEQEYYFADRTHAFSDRGQKLATRGADPEVIRSLIEIAKARGWDTITVKGIGDFPRNAWMEAAQNGLKVVGYQPTSLDLAELAKRPANNTVENRAVREKGAAPAQQQAAAQAAEASPVQPPVALQGAAAPVAQASEPDPELAKKAKAFEANKPAFVVKKYPDLVGAYGIVESAKAFAAEKLPDAAREEFVGIARRHVMQKIMAGEPVKGPKIYMAAAKARDANDQTQAPVQGAGDLGKSPREKGVARER
jgi:hypothetical protein